MTVPRDDVVQVRTGRGRGDQEGFNSGSLPALCGRAGGPKAGLVVVHGDPEAFDSGVIFRGFGGRG
jgi:hypothetical protein